MRRTAAVLVAITLGTVGFSACGDDDDGGDGDVSEEEQPYVDAMVASMQEDNEDITLTSEQAECVAPRWVRTIGVERMRDAGIEPEDIRDDDDAEIESLGLDEEQGGELFDAFGACDVDVQAMFVDSLAAENDLSDEDRDCLAENFDEDLLRRVMVTGLTAGDDALEQDEELTGDLLGVFAECPGAAG